MQPAAMTRTLHAVLIVCTVVSCSSCSSKKSSTRPPTVEALVQIGTVPIFGNGLNGSGNIVAVAYTDVSNVGTDTGFKETLKLYQQPVSSPDQLIELASVYLGVETLYHRVSDVTVTNHWAVVTMNDNIGPGGWVSAVSLDDSPSFTLDVFVERNEALDRATVSGNLLLIAAATKLSLFDITDPSSPSFIRDFTIGATTTSLVSALGGFLVFTTSGFGFLDVADPANAIYVEKADLDMKQSKKAYLVGSDLHLAGPSKNVGNCKIAVTDIESSTATPIFNDLIPGDFVDFAPDGVGNLFLLTTAKAYQYRIDNNAMVAVKSVARSTSARQASQFYAWNNRMYSLGNTVEILRMP